MEKCTKATGPIIGIMTVIHQRRQQHSSCTVIFIQWSSVIQIDNHSPVGTVSTIYQSFIFHRHVHNSHHCHYTIPFIKKSLYLFIHSFIRLHSIPIRFHSSPSKASISNDMLVLTSPFSDPSMLCPLSFHQK